MFYISCTPVTFNNTALNSNRISLNSLNRIMCECYIFSMWMWWADCCLCHFHHNQFLMPSIQLPEITNPSTFLEPHAPCHMPHGHMGHGAETWFACCTEWPLASERRNHMLRYLSVPRSLWHKRVRSLPMGFCMWAVGSNGCQIENRKLASTGAAQSSIMADRGLR